MEHLPDNFFSEYSCYFLHLEEYIRDSIGADYKIQEDNDDLIIITSYVNSEDTKCEIYYVIVHQKKIGVSCKFFQYIKDNQKFDPYKNWIISIINEQICYDNINLNPEYKIIGDMVYFNNACYYAYKIEKYFFLYKIDELRSVSLNLNLESDLGGGHVKIAKE